jgi:pyruvate kinase
MDMEPKNSTEVLVDAAVKIIEKNKGFKIAAVVIFTQLGGTARIFSRYRINLPLIAVTDNRDTAKSLLISYGVRTFLKKFKKSSFKMPKNIINKLLNLGLVSEGDNILVMHGSNWMESGLQQIFSL